jgi:lysophospholipase L1-like esterase
MVPTLAEPTGARAGAAGDPHHPSPLRLLVLGDSAALGLGAASQDDALLGHLVRALAPHTPLTYQLIARSGATAASTRRHLAARAWSAGDAADVVVTSLGLNDVTRGRSAEAILEDLEAIAALLGAHTGARHLLLSGLPPIGRFPALPQPLRGFLGRQAAATDRAMAHWAATRRPASGSPAVEHLPLPMDGHPAVAGASLAELMAPDGFHPGPRIYQAWGETAAARVEALHRGRAAG